MKPIWFFVGLLLTIIGGIVTASAIYSLIDPPAQPKVFSHLHPDLWWGIIMLAFGLLFALLNRRNIQPEPDRDRIPGSDRDKDFVLNK